MQAIVNDTYGPPEVLRVAEVPTPVPADDEVRVRIRATTVTRTDTAMRNATDPVTRLYAGLFKPRHLIPGGDFAGEVEAVGKAVTKFRVGDRVFGLSTFKRGTHAQFLCVSQDASIAPMPKNASFEEAAAVVDGLMLANNYVRKIDFTKTRKILVNGATGSIGSAALQLAKHHGAEVTATCRTALVDRIRALGADHVIDYTQQDFTKLDTRFEVILDMVGKSTFGACRHLLTAKGTYFSSELGPWGQNPLLALVTPLFGGRRVGFPIPSDSQADLLAFQKLVEEGKYVAVIDRTYPFAQVVDATRYVETGEKTGNVVLRID